MKVERILLKVSSPITEEDRTYNRNELAHLVHGVSCVSAGGKNVPRQYSGHTVSHIDAALKSASEPHGLKMFVDDIRTVEEYANGSSNIFFGQRDDNGPVGFVRVRPSVLFLVHPDECFERYFSQGIKDSWHRACYDQMYDEVVILWWGMGDDGDNDIIKELGKVQSVYGRQLFVWQPCDHAPHYVRDQADKFRGYHIDVAGCFRNECVAEWCLMLEKHGLAHYKVIEEMTI